MEGFRCDLCGAGPFSIGQALSTYKVTCLINIASQQHEHWDSRSPSNTTNIRESNEALLVTNEPLQQFIPMNQLNH